MGIRAGWLFPILLIAAPSLLILSPRHSGGGPVGRAGLWGRMRALGAVSDSDEVQKLPGLEQGVKVIRDTWGVPHIYAQNQHDMFFAQGFVTAQDRLFQMELWKRAGQGTLAEVLGPKYLDRDIGARLLKYRGGMAAEYASYAPDSKEIIEAFTKRIYQDAIGAWRAGLPTEFKEVVSRLSSGNQKIASREWLDFP